MRLKVPEHQIALPILLSVAYLKIDAHVLCYDNQFCYHMRDRERVHHEMSRFYLCKTMTGQNFASSTLMRRPDQCDQSYFHFSMMKT